MAIDQVETRQTTGPSGALIGQRIAGLVFGLIQLVIAARIVLLSSTPGRPTGSSQGFSI